jgi:hypothetical protein
LVKGDIILRRGRMPDPIKLSKALRDAGWKVKVYSNERLEPPHVTILCRGKVWRFNLREKVFMVPPGGKWGDIDPKVKDLVEKEWKTLCNAWNAKHPSNPVAIIEDEDVDN